MRRAAKVDANHAEIVQALRSVGWCVWGTFRMGEGFPDVLMARAGVLRLVEIKDGTKIPSKRKLTPPQVIFRDQLQAAGVPVIILSSVDEALAL